MSGRSGIVVRAVCAVLLGCLAAACTTGGDTTPATPPATAPSTSAAPRPTGTPHPTPTATPSPSASPTRPAPVRFQRLAAMADVRLLAGRIGPRLATGPGFREAGRLVAARFRALGYDVHRDRFPVPAGDSWGIPVAAGHSFNVIAEPAGFDPGQPHRVVGAHLDTVAVAPGAEDNASGVAVLLELARMAASVPPGVPTVFIAFGGEEPRGPGDALHHFGSMHYVRTLPAPQRRTLQAMVALDRVGVGRSVPVCTGGVSPPGVQRTLRALARRIEVPTHRCTLTTSDHWSFEKAGYPVARLGSTPYAGYHSVADRPGVVDPAQLRRTGRLVWAWLTA